MSKYMGQIMAECDCQHQACEMRGYCMTNRIEEIETENRNLRYMIIDQIKSAGDDPEIMAASRAEWAARAKAAEAKLAKAVEALEAIAKPKVGPDFDWAEDEVNRWMAVWYRKYADIARATLAELKGGD